MLSDGGFDSTCISLQARDNGCRRHSGTWRRAHRSRRSILTYLEECAPAVCHILPAANQYQDSQIEICDWLYEKAVTPMLSPRQLAMSARFAIC